MADFVGESTLGNWTLFVFNDGFLGGTLSGWTLHVTVAEPFDCVPFECPEASPPEAVTDFVVGKTVDGGDGSVDLTFGWDAVSGAAGYHLLESASAQFEEVVKLTGRTDGATSLVVEESAATSTGLTYYVVRSINGCNQEGP